MKILSVVFFCLFPLLSRADMAPAVQGQSGTVAPYYNKDIQMKDERIDIFFEKYFEPKYDSDHKIIIKYRYRVKVEYTFVNTGPAQAIVAGFPNKSWGRDGYPIENFRAFEGDKELTVFIKEVQFSDLEQGKSKEKPLPYPVDIRASKKLKPSQAENFPSGSFFECVELSFAAGETKKIINTYTADFNSDYDDQALTGEYILTTGAFWKDKIENMDVYFHLNDFSDYDIRRGRGYFSQDNVEGLNIDTENPNADPIHNTLFSKKRKNPNPRKEDEYDWKSFLYESLSFSKPDKKTFYINLKNIEPNFDLHFSLPPGMVKEIRVSSFLNSDIRYNGKNSIDNNSQTAWVEGALGPGIFDTIMFDIAPTGSGGKDFGYYKIKRLGIINGYAKSPELFVKNNRIKKLFVQIEFIDRPSGGGYDKEIISLKQTYILENTDKLQFINFDKPVKASKIIFKILSVYPGTHYDDTCLSEVYFYPE